MAVLYVVGTPIGNLEDVTLRALRILRGVGLVAAEDTRSTRHLLDAHHIEARVTSYHEHNKEAKLPYLLNYVKDHDIALVSEAGMPGISDPGFELIRAAVHAGISVVPVPGPSALITALAVSALPSDQFVYVGFLPRRPAERRRLLRSVALEPRTIVAFEAPHRLGRSLNEVLAMLGDRPIAVARELTKVHEEVFRGSVSEALSHFAQPRGEFTLVIGGASEAATPDVTPEVEEALAKLRQTGLSAKEAVAALSGETGLPRRRLYRVWISQQHG